MLFVRSQGHEQRSYTFDEAVAFLGFDSAAVEYWLRMGHIPASRDENGAWKIRPQALVAFLVEAGEPMPTGVNSCSLNKRVGTERVPAA